MPPASSHTATTRTVAQVTAATTPARSSRAGPTRRTTAALTWLPAARTRPPSANTRENWVGVSPCWTRSTNGEPAT